MRPENVCKTAALCFFFLSVFPLLSYVIFCLISVIGCNCFRDSPATDSPGCLPLPKRQYFNLV